MAHEDVTAAIIAGGQARRLGGRDKSRLVVRGRTIIIRQLDILQRVTPHCLIVSSHRDGRFDALGVPVVPDVIEGIGAIGGLLTALERAGTPLVVAVACDQPFLDTRLFEGLIGLARGADGAWVRTARGPEPLLACYQAHVAPRVRSAIEAGERRLSSLGALLRVRELTEQDLAAGGVPLDVIANINTPEDLARVE